MMDLPAEHLNAPKTEIEQIIASTTHTAESLKVSVPVRSGDPLQDQAEAIVGVFKDGFQWSDLTSMIRLSFEFVKRNQGLTISEQKDAIVKILNHIIDLTDTPLLPDDYTDPLFKSLMTPLVDLVTRVGNGQLNLIPAISLEKPTAATFKTYLLKLKATFSDGFQWPDLMTCLSCTVDFISGFPALTVDEKKESVIGILEGVIDMTDTPYLPDNYIDPVFKTIVQSTVDLVFNSLQAKK